MISQILSPISEGNTQAKILLINTDKDLSQIGSSTQETAYIKKKIELEQSISYLSSMDGLSIYVCLERKSKKNDYLELFRRKAAEAYALLKNNLFKEVTIQSNDLDAEEAFVEGLILSDYQFDKYKKEKSKFHLNKVYTSIDLNELPSLLQAVYWVRDLVNEPPAEQTATALANDFEKMASSIEGLEIEVFNKVQIESLRMGGLLSINRGSVQPPTFSILSWKPDNAINEKPIVIVGKGVVYDTGGINLKPTGYLETMKSDMSGSAIAAGLINAVASNKLPIYIISLIPATDNRPGGDAIVPSDVITMMGGKTVEIINTDAEGRMILADGLTYAEKYEPELVFSIATLTGSAARAFGSKAFVSMGNAKEQLDKLFEAALSSGERCWEMPFWDDYGKELESTIADVKHLGGVNGGAITAGKFLEGFVDSPYIHLDIAGVSFNEKAEDYKPVGGTGTSLRSLYLFLKNYISENNV